MNMTPQQTVIIEDDDLRDIAALRGARMFGVAATSRLGRAEEDREQAQQPPLHLVPPGFAKRKQTLGALTLKETYVHLPHPESVWLASLFTAREVPSQGHGTAP